MRTLTFTFDSSHSRPLAPSKRPTTSPAGVATVPSGQAEHFEVHGIADERVDVTEGTGTGIGPTWQRRRYRSFGRNYRTRDGGPGLRRHAAPHGGQWAMAIWTSRTMTRTIAIAR